MPAALAGQHYLLDHVMSQCLGDFCGHLSLCQRGWLAFTFIDRAWASPAPQIPHFYRQFLCQPNPPRSLPFIVGAKAAHTTHFYLIAPRSPPRILCSRFPCKSGTPLEGLGGRFAAERYRFSHFRQYLQKEVAGTL